jgi:hypothetical protein
VGGAVVSAGFTTGPWQVVGNGVRTHDDRYVCELSCPHGAEERDATARLIAAAPELHDALAVSTAFLDIEAEAHRSRGDIAKAESCEGQAKLNRKLLAKARGEQA